MRKFCKNCEHFIYWQDNHATYDRQAEGVCTAPRPLLGPPPNREVNKADGLNCPSFKEDTHNDCHTDRPDQRGSGRRDAWALASA